MKKLPLVLVLFALSSLSSCVIAVGVPREDWDECEVQTCDSCGAEVVCEACKASHPKVTIIKEN